MTERIFPTDRHGNPLGPARDEVVRCRDCKHFDQNDPPSDVYPDRYWCDLMANYLHPDGFCAWGARADA